MSHLVLSRRIGETIVIGDDVRVTITEIQRGQVRIAIDAPRSVPVNRLEVLELDSREAPVSVTA
jgi:carbon storage regulator